jgi:ApbE superfamily uncharacterized protein (UPF0280 family)
MAAAFRENYQVNSRAKIRMLPDGRRLHMHDGPIDLIVEAFGEAAEIRTAYVAATERFVNVLDELCSELPLLRSPVCESSPNPSGKVARRMVAAVRPYSAKTFITPMAAVAGAVAEDILAVMTNAARLSRAYVNDGGDIALHLAEGAHFKVGMLELPDAAPSPEPYDIHSKTSNTAKLSGNMFGSTLIEYACPIRGIATSGWRGRSFSLGVADAVTVLADTAAMADAAATVIANAVDLPGHDAIRRMPACELAPDSDLGELLVTQSVAHLDPSDICAALNSGARTARALIGDGLIRAAALHLQGETQVIGPELIHTLNSTLSSDVTLMRSLANA